MVEKIIRQYNNASEYYFLSGRKKSFFRKQYFQIVNKICSRRLYRSIKAHPLEYISTVIDTNLIVSVASFPARIDQLWLMLESVLRQSVRPKEIRVYLCKQEFEEAKKEIPVFFSQYEPYGVTICWTDTNLRSHDKYFYVLQDIKDELVITLDDDLYYPSNTLKRLLEMHKVNPLAICANITRKIDLNHFEDYNHWGKDRGENQKEESIFLVALGYGGVLYPPTFRPSSLFNISQIRSLAFYADDLWLKAIELVEHVDIVTSDYYPSPLCVPNTQRFALRKINCGSLSKNNEQWKKLDKQFDLKKYFFQSN